MKKNILGLIIIFSVNSLDVNAQAIEVKKQKASIFALDLFKLMFSSRTLKTYLFESKHKYNSYL